ncbi:hypothetical protein [Stenotrophomonas acidaminiphila]|jgi:hypothetical protein|uniref:hypothetical protein n=1 Tax=Stenotrophomonas acidaminiphila TaxID=128780 RepID=UPI0024ADD35D|nr:hypothetical protein [Stenotrophomonas acidaminiphila]WHL18518.1 hypothetical protein QLF99_15930 [Stenotrophomonas acidaminiphila]
MMEYQKRMSATMTQLVINAGSVRVIAFVPVGWVGGVIEYGAHQGLSYRGGWKKVIPLR